MPVKNLFEKKMWRKLAKSVLELCNAERLQNQTFLLKVARMQ
jgi:hypothetical protein